MGDEVCANPASSTKRSIRTTHVYSARDKNTDECLGAVCVCVLCVCVGVCVCVWWVSLTVLIVLTAGGLDQYYIGHYCRWTVCVVQLMSGLEGLDRKHGLECVCVCVCVRARVCVCVCRCERESVKSIVETTKHRRLEPVISPTPRGPGRPSLFLFS